MLRRISWMALRQMQSIRESVAFTLRDGAIGRSSTQPDSFYAEWLAAQGVEPFYYRHMPAGTLHLSFLGTVERSIASHGIDMDLVQSASTHSRFDDEDVGSERGSAGWDRLPNFITSSALIRVLGAMEQYELDVLKALLHYRPAGKQHPLGMPFLDAEMSVVTEAPDTDGRYSMPALWSWIKKPAENTVERRKIFKNVFGIDCFPPKFGSLRPNEIKAYYQSVYDQRNSLAHGRSLVDVSLADYCKAEAFALTLFSHLSSTCHKRYSLGV